MTEINKNQLIKLIEEVKKELPSNPKTDSQVEKDLRYAAIFARRLANRRPRLTYRQLKEAIADLEDARESKNSISNEIIITYPLSKNSSQAKAPPKVDKNGRVIDPMTYSQVFLKTDGHGTINGEHQLGILVKNGLSYRKLLEMLEIKPDEDYEIWQWEKINANIIEDSIAHGFTDRLSFIKSAMAVKYDAKLPAGYHKVIVNRYPSIKAGPKIGLAYAYKDGSYLDPAIFPDLKDIKAETGHEQTYWNMQIGDRLIKNINIKNYRGYVVKEDIKFILGANKIKPKELPLRISMRFEPRDRQRNIELMFSNPVDRVEVKINKDQAQTFTMKDKNVNTYHKLDLEKPLKKSDIIKVSAFNKKESRTMTYQVVR